MNEINYVIIERKSIISGKKNQMKLNISMKEYAEGLKKMKQGMLIQKALPNLSATEREFLLTGMNEVEQDKIFKETEE